MTVEAGQAWYVYGVLPPRAAAEPVAPPPGAEAVLPGAAVQAINLGPVAVLASLVPRALFDRAHVANRTADPAWMAARIAAHHAVNAIAAVRWPCLPLAFGTLFSSLDLARDRFTPRAAALLAALARVAGRAEWALSLQEDAPAHAAWLDQHDPALRVLVGAIAEASEGTAFLMARRLDKVRAAARRSHLEAIAALVAARLAAGGGEVLADPSRAPLPGWTILSPHDPADPTAPPLLAALAGPIAPGLTLRLTGPWPAYAFARTALADDSAQPVLADDSAPPVLADDSAPPVLADDSAQAVLADEGAVPALALAGDPARHKGDGAHG
jgi:hypothetical protein